MERIAVVLAALVVVPLLLPYARAGTWPRIASPRVAAIAALFLVVSVALPTGLAAGLFALPWLAFTGLIGLGALVRGVPLLARLIWPNRWLELSGFGACGFLAVGGLFLFFDRVGFQPGGFSAEIILLTAVHFHFAGFGLLTIGRLVAGSHPGLRPAVLGLVAGIPVTAGGFVLGSNPLNAFGATLTGVSGIAIGAALLAGWLSADGLPGALGRVAGAAMLVAMPMGIAWSVTIALGSSFLDIERMVATHGALNGTAVVIASIALLRVPDHRQTERVTYRAA